MFVILRFHKVNNSELMESFYKFIYDEESYEIGSNPIKTKLFSFFNKLFGMKESENENIINSKLNEDIKEEFELVSGYLPTSWEDLIKEYQDKTNDSENTILISNWVQRKNQYCKEQKAQSLTEEKGHSMTTKNEK